ALERQARARIAVARAEGEAIGRRHGLHVGPVLVDLYAVGAHGRLFVRRERPLGTQFVREPAHADVAHALQAVQTGLRHVAERSDEIAEDLDVDGHLLLRTHYNIMGQRWGGSATAAPRVSILMGPVSFAKEALCPRSPCCP